MGIFRVCGLSATAVDLVFLWKQLSWSIKQMQKSDGPLGNMGLSENSVSLNPMVNDHHPY